MKKDRCTVIVLAGGRGSRMESDIPKQYIRLNGYPVLYYSLKQFEKSPVIEEIILVAGEEELTYCREEIVERYGIHKVKKIVPGGKERFYSVYNGLAAATGDYIFIHDGARPFIEEQVINRAYEAVQKYQACAVGVKAKDTIKIGSREGFIAHTPERETVWQIQTPQVFEVELIKKAYRLLMEDGRQNVTDDAMVVETFLGKPVKLVEGSDKNIKVTTPSDLQIAAVFVGDKIN